MREDVGIAKIISAVCERTRQRCVRKTGVGFYFESLLKTADCAVEVAHGVMRSQFPAGANQFSCLLILKTRVAFGCQEARPITPGYDRKNLRSEVMCDAG